MEATARRRRGVGTVGCIESCLRQRILGVMNAVLPARVHRHAFTSSTTSHRAPTRSLPQPHLEPSCSHHHTVTLDAGRQFPCRHYTCGHHTSVLHFVLGQIPCITHWPCIPCRSLEQRGFQCMDSNWRVACLFLPLHPN